MPWSTGGDDGTSNKFDNAAVWKVMENAAVGGGIPDELNLAILVQRDEGFFKRLSKLRYGFRGVYGSLGGHGQSQIPSSLSRPFLWGDPWA